MKILLIALTAISLNSCIPVVTSPEVRGVVVDSNKKSPIARATILSRKYDHQKFRLITQTDRNGKFHLRKQWGIAPIPHSYIISSRQLRVVADGYEKSSTLIEDNPKKALSEVNLNQVISLTRSKR